MEPVYTYKKGQGWVPVFKKPNPHNDLDKICKNCGQCGGRHCGTPPYNCPNSDVYGRFYKDTVFDYD